jgi:hypothetical protein
MHHAPFGNAAPNTVQLRISLYEQYIFVSSKWILWNSYEAQILLNRNNIKTPLQKPTY